MNPVISIILPVFRENATIVATLNHLHALRGAEDMECLVVDGSPEGGTLAAVTHPKVIKICAPKGRGVQMNRGAAVARGAIYLFPHADTQLSADALVEVRRTLLLPGVAAGAFTLGIAAPGKAYRLIEAMVSLRSRHLGMPYGDQAIFIQSGLFHRLGGYREIPLMEDVDLIRRVRATGARVAILDQRVKTSPRRWEKEGILFCTLRNWTLMTLYLMGRRPEKLAKYYREE